MTDTAFEIVERVFDRTELSSVAARFEHELTTRSRAGARHLRRAGRLTHAISRGVVRQITEVELAGGLAPRYGGAAASPH